MKEMLKKGFYSGLGAGLLLRDEILNALNAPVKVDDVPIQELRAQLGHALEKFSSGMSQGADALKQAGEEEMSDLLRRVGLAKAEDVEALKARIADLEARLDQKKNKKKAS